MRARREAKLAVGTLALLLACGPPPSRPLAGTPAAQTFAPSRAAASIRAPQFRAVVAIVVDQLAGWIASERIPLLPESGGFARLRREGTWAKEMRFMHAVTDTAPGHASLFTGLVPHEHGIGANERIDRSTRKPVSILTDAEAQTLSPSGTRPGGVSIQRLKSDTVADRLRKEVPNAWIFSASWKDRGAVFAGGRHPDAVVWHDGSRNEFVTSSTFAREFPSWLRAAPELDAIRKTKWTLVDRAWVEGHAASKDEDPSEGNLESVGTKFPHSFERAKGLGLRLSPRADEALVHFLEQSLDRAVLENRPKIFASVSLSTTDYIGHVFGPDSWEAWEELLELDALLAALMTDLDRRFGVDGWALVLSADHGACRTPERERALLLQGSKLAFASRPPARISPEALRERLQDAARREVGPGDYILGVAAPYVYFTDNALALDREAWTKFWRALALELASTEGVEKVVLVQKESIGEALEDASSAELRTLVVGSLTRDAGELLVLPRAGSYFDALYVPGKGGGHGSSYANDRIVPLFVRAPGFARAGSVLGTSIDFRSFATTLSWVLGIDGAALGGANLAKDRATP